MKGTCSLLGQYIDIISGAAFKSDNFLDDPSHVPLIKGENIGQGTILWEKSKYWPKDKTEEYIRYFLEPGDIVLAMDRPWVNAGLKYALISEKNFKSLLVQRVARLRAKKGLIQQFLRYIVSSLDFSKYIKSCMRGTNIPHISADQIRNFRCQIPPIDVQKGIINILSSYDDLIENNRRRIQLLEESARLLYKEWFVRLRFPGHEHVKVVDGVPEGWERKKFADISDIIGGGTPKTQIAEYWDGDITWVVPTDVTRNDSIFLLSSERKITEKGLKESSARIVPPYTILMTSRASVGYFAMMDHEVCTNQGFINIIPYLFEYRMYFLFNLMSRVDEIRKKAKGTTYLEISKGVFASMEIIIPQEPLITQFCGVASNIFDQICCLQKQNAKLAQARDLLLPKLMSGEVSV